MAAAEMDGEHAQWDMLCARAEAAGVPGRYVTALRHIPHFARMMEWDVVRLAALRGAANLVVDAYEQDAARSEARPA